MRECGASHNVSRSSQRRTTRYHYAPIAKHRVVYPDAPGRSTATSCGCLSHTNKVVFLRARYYSTQLGRFLSRDKWDGENYRPLTLNRWNYVISNPLKYTDPSGFMPWCPPNEYEDCIQQINPLALRAEVITRHEDQSSIPLDCMPDLNKPIIRTLVVNVSPYVGVIVVSYDREKVTRPIYFEDKSSMMNTGEQSVIMRTMLAEETGWRLLHNIHSLASVTGIYFVAQNRASLEPSTKYLYRCSNAAECMLREGAFALMVAEIGWDPLCYKDGNLNWPEDDRYEYYHCQNAYGTKNQYADKRQERERWLHAIDLTAIAYNLVKKNLIPDFTNGATEFKHTYNPLPGTGFNPIGDNRVDYRTAFITCVYKKVNPSGTIEILPCPK